MLAYTLTIEKLVTVFGYPSVRAHTLTLSLTIEKLVTVFGCPRVRARALSMRPAVLSMCPAAPAVFCCPSVRARALSMRPAVLSMRLGILVVFGGPSARARLRAARMLRMGPAVLPAHAGTVQMVHHLAAEHVGPHLVRGMCGFALD